MGSPDKGGLTVARGGIHIVHVRAAMYYDSQCKHQFVVFSPICIVKCLHGLSEDKSQCFRSLVSQFKSFRR